MPPAVDDSLGKNSRYYKVGLWCARRLLRHLSSLIAEGRREPRSCGGWRREKDTRQRKKKKVQRQTFVNRLASTSPQVPPPFIFACALFSSDARALELMQKALVSTAEREGEARARLSPRKARERGRERGEGRLALFLLSPLSRPPTLFFRPCSSSSHLMFFLNNKKKLPPDPGPQLRHLRLRRALRRSRDGPAGGGQVYRARGQGEFFFSFFETFLLGEKNDPRKKTNRIKNQKKIKNRSPSTSSARSSTTACSCTRTSCNSKKSS